MKEDDVERSKDDRTKLDKTKEVVKKHWKPFTVGAGTIIVIYIVTRQVNLRYAPVRIDGTNLLMKRVRFNKSVLLHITNVFGAPVNTLSKAVKCVETGQEAISQNMMAKSMGLSASSISSHLNFPESTPHVKGYHFVRLGIVDYNHGNWDLSK